MAKSESDIFTPRTGQVIQAENGTQYFVCGNNRIKISEHFAAGGKPLGDLIVDVVRHTAEKHAYDIIAIEQKYCKRGLFL